MITGVEIKKTDLSGLLLWKKALDDIWIEQATTIKLDSGFISYGKYKSKNIFGDFDSSGNITVFDSNWNILRNEVIDPKGYSGMISKSLKDGQVAVLFIQGLGKWGYSPNRIMLVRP